jgi:hypothetical protein
MQQTTHEWVESIKSGEENKVGRYKRTLKERKQFQIQFLFVILYWSIKKERNWTEFPHKHNALEGPFKVLRY